MKRKKIIAVCTTNASEETVVERLTMLHKSASREGYRLVIFSSAVALYANEANYEGDCYVYKNINFRHFDAVISFSEYIKDEDVLSSIVNGAAAAGIPVFSVDRYVEGCINIVMDYATAFEKLVRHVVEFHKCRKVNFISGVPEGQPGHEFSLERENIYKKVLADNKIPFEKERLDHGWFWEGPTEEVLKRFLAADEYPDAIICANDVMAITACEKLEEKGLRVPEDVIVTGYDGFKRGKWNSPSITTCEIDFSIITDLIIKVIKEAAQGIEPEKLYTVPFEFVPCESCGCKEKTHNVTHKDIFEIYNYNKGHTYYQMEMYEMQKTMSEKESVMQLASVLYDHMISDGYIIVKNSIPEFALGNRGEDDRANAAEQSMRVLVRKKGEEIQMGDVFPISDIIPGLDSQVTVETPLIVLPLHSSGQSYGYMVFCASCQPIFFSEIVMFNYTLGNALEIYKNQKSLKAVNKKIEEINKRMAELYIRDPLTSLYNRRGFYNNIAKLMDECIKNGWEMFVASVDLDELKPINDMYGHAEGDNAIKTIAKALEVNVHAHEICARFGGDEFVVAGIAESGEINGNLYVKNVEKYLENYNRDAGKPYTVRASIGLSVKKPVEGTPIDSLIIDADKLMYEKKKLGRLVRSSVRELRTDTVGGGDNI